LDAATIGNIVVGGGWGLFELVLARTRRSSDAGAKAADSATWRLLWIVIVAALAVGITLGVLGVGRLPDAYPALAFVGQGLIVAGLLLRVVAIRTLSKFFTVDVAVHAGHEVIQKGVYRWIRHPAYTGNLLSFLGLGVCFCSWASTLAIFVPVTAAFLVRIRLEEKVLVAALGDAYVKYQERTRKLLPMIF